MDIKDAKSLMTALHKLYIEDENNNSKTTIYIDGSLKSCKIFIDKIDDITEEDLKNVDEIVNKYMKIFEPDSKNSYYDFYTYFGCQEKINELKDRVKNKIESNWENISKVLHERIDSVIGVFDEEKMRNLVIDFHLLFVKVYSFTTLEVKALFSENHYCTDTSPMEALCGEYEEKYMN